MKKLFSVDVKVIGEERERYITNVSKIRTEKDYIHFEREDGNITFNKNFVVSYHINSYGEPVDENESFQDAKEQWERTHGRRGGYQPRKTKESVPDNPPKNQNCEDKEKSKKNMDPLVFFDHPGEPTAPPSPPDKRKINHDIKLPSKKN